jgi:hypothetical protein
MQNQFCSAIQMASSSKSYWPCKYKRMSTIYTIRSTSSLLYCIPNPINTGTRIMNNDDDLCICLGLKLKIKWKSEKYLLIWYIHTYDKGNKHSTFGERCANKLWSTRGPRAFRWSIIHVAAARSCRNGGDGKYCN